MLQIFAVLNRNHSSFKFPKYTRFWFKIEKFSILSFLHEYFTQEIISDHFWLRPGKPVSWRPTARLSIYVWATYMWWWVPSEEGWTGPVVGDKCSCCTGCHTMGIGHGAPLQNITRYLVRELELFPKMCSLQYMPSKNDYLDPFTWYWHYDFWKSRNFNL